MRRPTPANPGAEIIFSMQMKKNREPAFIGRKSVIINSAYRSFELEGIEDLPAVTIKESEMLSVNNCEDSASARPL